MSNYDAIVAKIEKLQKAEKITKKMLAELSRDVLEYINVDESNDIATVNRLLDVLTPMNRKTAVLFFAEFLPFKHDDRGVFGKKIKGEKRIAEKLEQAKAFLADEENNIWVWAESNIKVEKAPIDYAKKISKDVQKALSDEEDGITAGQVLAAVLEGGVTLGDLVALMDQQAEDQQEAA